MDINTLSDRFTKATLAAEQFSRTNYKGVSEWLVVVEARLTIVHANNSTLLERIAREEEGLKTDIWVKSFFGSAKFTAEEAWAIVQNLEG
jgi:hypothetical protein